jgi:WD40-like Beta Propeller Repeat
MNELNAFECRLAAGLDAYAGPRRSLDADAIARSAASRLPLRRSILLRLPAVVAPAPPFAWGAIAVIALLVLALAAGALLTGGAQPRLPAVVGPAGNGLIVYASGGDIFVGDAFTGTTTAIVTGTARDTRPVFSPDGSRIAFIRLDPSAVGETGPAYQPCGPTNRGCRVVVVRPDGSAERVITPGDFGRFHDFLAWTPDGRGIVVNYENGLAVLDPEGAADPQIPQLKKWPGTAWFDPNAQVAPMLRPPAGDRILSYEGSTITERDAAGTRLRQIIGPERMDAGLVSVWPAWSPDGSKIAFNQVDSSDGLGVFVMNADGSDVRFAGRGHPFAWSPDGSRIAVGQSDLVPAGSTAYCPDSWSQDHCPSASWISIVDVDAGTERMLEGTHNVAGDEEAGIVGYSWAPDGRSLLLLRKPGTRLVTVDVETGLASELPWEADSPGSWQRVAATGSR